MGKSLNMFGCSRKFSWERFVLRTFSSLWKDRQKQANSQNADSPSAPAESNAPTHLSWGNVHILSESLLDSMYEITIYLWVILKYLSITLLAFSHLFCFLQASSLRGKLLITLNEMLKRPPGVKRTLQSRGRKSSQVSNSIRIYLWRMVLYADQACFHSSQGKGKWWLAHLCSGTELPMRRGLIRVRKHFTSCFL